LERRRLAGDIDVLTAAGLESRGVVTAFAERTGGESRPPFASLNLGFGTGDDPDRVRRNRGRLAAALQVSAFAVARQVHGVEVVRVPERAAGAGFGDAANALGPGDVLATTARAVPLAVLVADCLPIVLASDELLVAVHAGWRGLAAGILARAAALFEDASRVAAAIGPAIGPCHYEVGPEVPERVASAVPHAPAFTRTMGGRLHFDLRAAARWLLEDAGATVLDAEDPPCTWCDERFFSHRREGARAGRQAGVAWLS
jgi:YfiH family protein